jgi:signal transduction histidine kinase
MPESGGLRQRLASTIHDVEEEFAIAVRLDLADRDDRALASISPSLVGAVLRATREGLVNAAKHARPCQVRVIARLVGDDVLEVRVEDDGLALVEGPGAGHGLESMQRLLRPFGGDVGLGRENAVTVFRVTVPFYPGG